MKLLYLSWFNSGEGSQVHAKEFMNAMQDIGNTVIPIELSLQSGETLKKKYQHGNIQSSPRNHLVAILKEMKSVAANFFRVMRLFKLYKKYKPDAIINRYQMYDFSAIVAGKLLRVPIMYEVNASAVYERKIENRYYLPALGSLIEKLVFRYSDIVTVVSSDLKKYFSDHNYMVKNTIVIPNGVNMNSYTSQLEIPEELVSISQKWANNIIIGFLGSLKSWHGVERLVNIFPTLLKNNNNFRLLIVGDGNERQQIESLVKRLEIEDYVHITGFLDHKKVPAALSLFSIAVAPYQNIQHFYFSPLKIFEYMAAGKPIVAPALGQINELVINSQNGYLLSQNTNDELILKITELSRSSHLIKQFGDSAKRRVEENFTWEVNARKISSAIISKMNKKNKR